MDAFRTDAETAFRRKAADYFRGPGGRTPPEAVPAPEKIWRDLDIDPGAGGTAKALGGWLFGRISLCEEAAGHDPKLGSDLVAWLAAAGTDDPLERRLRRSAWLAGTAAHVLEAGVRTARERGDFSSSLMGCREVQESLAGLVAGAELVRLGTCRLCRLLERGRRDRAEAEMGPLEARAGALARDIRAVAGALLGGPWVETNLPSAASHPTTKGNDDDPRRPL